MPTDALCRQAIAHVTEALNSGDLDRIGAETQCHISRCARCRGALLALLQELSTAPDQVPISCGEVLASLPGYIDLELTSPDAAQRYPGLWQHLWGCETCRALYDMTRELVRAQRSGALPLIERETKQA